MTRITQTGRIPGPAAKQAPSRAPRKYVYGRAYISALWAVTLLSLAAGISGVVFGLSAMQELRVAGSSQAAELAAGGAESAVEIPAQQIPGEYVFPIRPDDYKMLSDKFGYRISPILHVERDHDGLDIAAVEKAQVVAIADGIVLNHWLPPGSQRGDTVYGGHEVYGGAVHIRHSDGVESLYAHLSRTYIREGQTVRAGQVIGRIGNTGRSVREHLHIEIRVNGELQNPLHYLPKPEDAL